MRALNRHSHIWFILLCGILCSMHKLSLHCSIPDYFSIAGLIIICFIYILENRHWKKLWRIINFPIAIGTGLFLLWTEFCWPYFNSEITYYTSSKECICSKEQFEKISRSEAIKDIEFTFNHIKKIHPAFRDSIPSQFKKEYQQSYNRINSSDSISIGDLHISIQTFIATLHDAHTNISPFVDNWHSITGSKYGKLISVNGIPLDSIFQIRKHQYSFETEEFGRKCIIDDLYCYELISFLGLNKDVNSFSFQTDDRDTTTLYFTIEDYFNQKGEGNTSFSQTPKNILWVNDTINIGYICIPSFNSYEKNYREEFKNELSAFFAEIDQKNIENLIIDLRYNVGGNNHLWMDMMNYFSECPIEFGTRIRRRGPFMLESKNKCLCNHPVSNRFTGKIFVLTSCMTFSAAMEFTDCLQGNNLATIVGTSPGNKPNCFTNITQFCLPNSHFHLHIATEAHKRTRPELGDTPIIPDFECPSDDAYNQVAEIVKMQQDSK